MENEQNEQNGQNEKSRGRVNKILIVLLVLIIIAAAIIVAVILSRPKSQPVSQGGVKFDPNAGEYEDVDDNASEQGVAIPGWGTITIPPNETEITVDFFNPEANEGQYYLTFELRLPDDSEQGYEVLYTSGLVEPGLHIQHITLAHGLEVGNYDAIIHVQPYRMDEAQTPTNNADMKTELIVI